MIHLHTEKRISLSDEAIILFTSSPSITTGEEAEGGRG